MSIEFISYKDVFNIMYDLGVPIEHIAVAYKKMDVALFDDVNDEVSTDFIIDYQEDTTGGYTDGFFRFMLYLDGDLMSISTAILTSEIVLVNYCSCTPEDKGYNQQHECCGVKCDWTKPMAKITTQEYMCNDNSHTVEWAWEGTAQELWNTVDYLQEEVLDIVN